MPFYVQKGKIPPKRHTAFKDNDGNIYYEELVSREGFSSLYSNYYHINRPTKIRQLGSMQEIKLNNSAKNHRHRHIVTSKIENSGDLIKSRTPLFFNNEVTISTSHISQSMDYFYRNGYGDELLYIQYGTGKLHSNLGDLNCIEGDYIIIPRGIIWQLNPDNNIKMFL